VVTPDPPPAQGRATNRRVEHFSWDSIAERTMAVHRSVLGTP
jgi:hypothetical protein